MKICADVFAVVGFWLLVDLKIIPELWFRMFLKNKHGNYYTKFDNFVLSWKDNYGIYNPDRDAIIKFLAFISLLLSGILSLIDNFV